MIQPTTTLRFFGMLWASRRFFRLDREWAPSSDATSEVNKSEEKPGSGLPVPVPPVLPFLLARLTINPSRRANNSQCNGSDESAHKRERWRETERTDETENQNSRNNHVAFAGRQFGIWAASMVTTNNSWVMATSDNRIVATLNASRRFIGARLVYLRRCIVGECSTLTSWTLCVCVCVSVSFTWHVSDHCNFHAFAL